MVYNYTARAATEDGNHLDCPRPLCRTVTFSKKKTQQGDFDMESALYLVQVYRRLISKEDRETILQLCTQWVGRSII